MTLLLTVREFLLLCGVVQRNLLDPVLGTAAKRRGKAAGVRGVSHT